MKHVIVIETSGTIGPNDVDTLRQSLAQAADDVLGEDNFLQLIANQPSATRGVYRLYRMDESKSPDEHRSAE
jgi:hypothetical protein